MEKLKKLFISIVILLAFSMLSTSVSAPVPDYYWVGFYGEVSGPCQVFDPPGPPVPGKGSVHVRGSAIGIDVMAGFYLAGKSFDLNTRIWPRRTRMTVSWNNEKLTVWMWPSYTVWGLFNDTIDYLYIGNLTFFGYYMGEAGLQFVSGSASVLYSHDPLSFLQVALVTGTAPWLTLYWMGSEYDGWPVARHVMRRVTVLGPIPWHPNTADP